MIERYFNKRTIPVIGEGVVLVNTLLDCGGQITIGDFSFFGHDCKILTGSHDYLLRNKARRDTAIYKPVTIGKGVWVASGVIITQGVIIGDNSVVGAGSVVTRDIPPNELWAGVPAKFIKKI